MESTYIWTKDNLRLQGVHYDSGKRDLCVLFIHGMSGNFIENYFADVLGRALEKSGIGFIYSHNRGYSHINDIVVKSDSQDSELDTVRIGVTYERFEESVYDIDAWVSQCRNLGYEKIILLGHSLGCNKSIHYLSQNKSKDIAGLILASPPDMVGLFKKPEYQEDYEKLLKEAKENVKNGNPRKILSSIIWDWYNLSSQTFLDLSIDGCPADNLPVLRNPEKFDELSLINVPILGIMGEKDDIAINDLESDLKLINSKATSCPKFDTAFVEKANHVYDKHEEDFARIVLKWIKHFDKTGKK